MDVVDAHVKPFTIWLFISYLFQQLACERLEFNLSPQFLLEFASDTRSIASGDINTTDNYEQVKNAFIPVHEKLAKTMYFL
jgi:hypothetical protein